MTFGTHVVFASVLYLGGATLFGYKPDLIGWLLAAVAALLPDADLPTSKVGRLFFWLSVPLERRFGHRTVTHSAVGLLAVAAVASPLWPVRPLYFGCALGGYWSHLWIDMLNVRGVDLFWPSPVRLVTPGNRHWRMEVGSKAEMALLSALLALAVALYPLSHLGFRDALQAVIRSFDIALDQPGRDRQQVVVSLALAHRARLALVQHDEAALPRPDDRVAARHPRQRQVIRGHQLQVVPVRSDLALVLLHGNVEALEQRLQRIPEAQMAQRIQRHG